MHGNLESKMKTHLDLDVWKLGFIDSIDILMKDIAPIKKMLNGLITHMKSRI